jgi:FkbM family methyltransferase
MSLSIQMLEPRGQGQESSAPCDHPRTLGGATNLQELAAIFARASDDYLQVRDEASLHRLRALRLQIIEALLAHKNLEPELASSVNSVVGACLKSRLRDFPRTRDEEELFHRCLTAVNSAPREAPALWFSAALTAWHAFELPHLPPLTAIPQEAHSAWLTLILEMPHAFVRCGDAVRFVDYLQGVCDLLLQYLRATIGPVDDLAPAFFSSTAFMQCYFNELNLRELMAARAAIIEDLLTRRGYTLDQLRVTRPCRDRPRIGFIVLGASDGTETTGLAGYLERLDRRRFEARLYSVLEPSGIMGRLCRASAETYVNLSRNVSAAVTQLRGDDLDIAFFCSNLTAVTHLVTHIAAHRVAPIQVTTLTASVTTGLRNMDLMISGATFETENSAEQYTEHLVLAEEALVSFPFQRILEGQTRPDPVFRSAYGIPDDSVLFFSGANFYKIVPELSELWFHILSRVPNSRLILMPFNPNWASNYPLTAFVARLVAQAAAAGVALDRLHILPPVPTIAHVRRIMEIADIYLDSFPFNGGSSYVDPLTVGLPIVARYGTVFRSRQSKAILEHEGLGDWACPDAQSYAERAIELARNPDLRAKERERLDRIRRTGIRLSDTAAYAPMMMRTYDRIVADWNKRVQTLRATDSDELAKEISALASERAKRGDLFTDRDLVAQVVLPYLRNGGTKRLIEIGAFMGDVSKPFLQEGWQGVMFEPDERCQQQLAALAEAHPGQLRIEKAAVTPDHDDLIQFHLAGPPGLSGLSRSPFVGEGHTLAVRSVAVARYISAEGLFDTDFINIDAEGHEFAILNAIDLKAMTPRLIMVGFDQAFADQDRASTQRSLASMRARGYRACIVCLRAFGRFKRYEWPKSLLTIGIDAIPQLPDGFPLFGNILFFREDDRDFLPSLYDWVEQPVAWEKRRNPDSRP